MILHDTRKGRGERRGGEGRGVEREIWMERRDMHNHTTRRIIC